MAERSLTVTWQDPRGLAARATEGSGLDFLRGFRLDFNGGLGPKSGLCRAKTDLRIFEGRLDLHRDPRRWHFTSVASDAGATFALCHEFFDRTKISK